MYSFLHILNLCFRFPYIAVSIALLVQKKVTNLHLMTKFINHKIFTECRGVGTYLFYLVIKMFIKLRG